MGWTAGWNMPGYLPEADPIECEDWTTAQAVLVEMVERAWDYIGDEAPWAEVHTALHGATPEEPFAVTTSDGQVTYWISESEPVHDDEPPWLPDTLKEARGEA